jgi:hypothetical protein
MENKRHHSTSGGRMQANATASGKSGLSRRSLLLTGAALIGSGGMIASAMAGSSEAVTVWKSATCGCCGGWVGYMRDKGYRVTVNVVPDPDAIKASLGIPEPLYSCHTARIGDYLVEGHVPEKAIAKLLAERPDLKGIALPGMPPGSPGMDGTPGIYRVVGFEANGRIRAFMSTGI